MASMLKKEIIPDNAGVTNQLKFFNNGMPLRAFALSPLLACLYTLFLSLV
jgi:hypothetical protein